MNVFAGLLRGFRRFLAGLQDLVRFSGLVLRACFRPLYLRDLYEQAYYAGVGSLHLAVISAFFAGQALGLQFSRQLEQTGSKSLLGLLMTISVVRALGPDLTGLVVASRLASGYTAEIGAMRSANQIDALTAFGTDPIRKLAVPRFLALLVMLPMLVIVADFVGIFGGYVIAYLSLGLPTSQYWTSAHQALEYNDIVQGMLKPFVFAFVISLVGCYYGLRTSGGTQGVGRSTTQAVVVASVWIFVITALLTRIFVNLH